MKIKVDKIQRLKTIHEIFQFFFFFFIKSEFQIIDLITGRNYTRITQN